MLLIITSSAYKLSGVTNINDLERLPKIRNPKIGGFSEFFGNFSLRRTSEECIFAKIAGSRPRQLAYEIKLLLLRVSRALAESFCNKIECME